MQELIILCMHASFRLTIFRLSCNLSHMENNTMRIKVTVIASGLTKEFSSMDEAEIWWQARYGRMSVIIEVL